MRAVLWDMDGTLVDSEHLHSAATAEVLSAKGLQPDAAFLDSLMGMGLDEVVAHVNARYDAGFDLDTFQRQQIAAFLERCDQTTRLPAASVYESLRDAGKTTAIVTNSDRMVADATLRGTDLLVPGATVISISDVRRGKPDPELYLRAAWLLNARPQDCLVVEDSGPGAQAGVAAGMRTLVLNHYGLSPQVDGAEILQTSSQLEAEIHAWMA